MSIASLCSWKRTSREVRSWGFIAIKRERTCPQGTLICEMGSWWQSERYQAVARWYYKLQSLEEVCLYFYWTQKDAKAPFWQEIGNKQALFKAQLQCTCVQINKPCSTATLLPEKHEQRNIIKLPATQRSALPATEFLGQDLIAFGLRDVADWSLSRSLKLYLPFLRTQLFFSWW